MAKNKKQQKNNSVKILIVVIMKESIQSLFTYVIDNINFHTFISEKKNNEHVYVR